MGLTIEERAGGNGIPLQAERSLCDCHVVWKGSHRGFEMNPVAEKAPRESRSKRVCAIDQLGEPYIRLSVGERARDVALAVITEGYLCPWVRCASCGTEQVRHKRQLLCRVAAGGCGKKLGDKSQRFQRHYVVADGYVRKGEGATLVLFRKDSLKAPKTPARFREDLGVAAVIGSQSDEQRYQKYYKRYLAPVLSTVSGRVTKRLPNGFEARLVKRRGDELVCLDIRVHTPDLKKKTYALVLSQRMRRLLNDRGVKYAENAAGESILPAELFHNGSLLMKSRLASFLLNERVSDGAGLQMTVGTPWETFKGIAEVDDRLRWDFVGFDGKSQLAMVGDGVTFQVMNKLKASGQEYTDAQSWIAKDMSKVGPGMAVEAMMKFEADLRDDAGIQRQMEAIMEGMTPHDLEDRSDPCWSLVQGFAAGLPVGHLPWSRRRLRTFFTTEMLNMARLRVPYPEWAVGAYFAGDRSARDADGFYCPGRAQLVEGTCVIPFVDGARAVSAIRRPIECQASESMLRQVWCGEVSGYEGLGGAERRKGASPFIFVSMASIALMVLLHNGADFDDYLQILLGTVELRRREKDAAERPYPVAPVLAELAEKEPEGAVYNPWNVVAAVREHKRSVRHPFQVLRGVVSRGLGYQPGLSIARASNALMLENQLWNDGRVAEPTLAPLSANLDHVIDVSVHVAKGGGSEADAGLVRLVDGFYGGLTAVDRVLVERVPSKVAEKVAWYEGSLSRAVKEIRLRQKQFLADMEAEDKAALEEVVPPMLEKVAETADAVALLASMREYWYARKDVHDAELRLQEAYGRSGRLEGRADPEAIWRTDDKCRDLSRPKGHVAAFWGLCRALLVSHVAEGVRYSDVQIAALTRVADELVFPEEGEKFETAVGVESFKRTQEELFVRFRDEDTAVLLQAVAVCLKRAYLFGQGLDFMFAGDHTVEWYIAVWKLLHDPDAGFEQLCGLGTHQAEGAAEEAFRPAGGLGAVTVAAGLQKRGLAVDSPEVVEWLSHAGRRVVLEAAKVKGGDVVQVYLEDGHVWHSTVRPSQLRFVDGRRAGVLRLHAGTGMGFAMQVVLDA